jgi:hypothetical protein
MNRLVCTALLTLAACGATPLEPDAFAPTSAHERLGNWAGEDTDGVGTHRVAATDLNVRAIDGAVIDVAQTGQQLVLTTRTTVTNGTTFMEAVFKGGALDGTVGWVASQYLLYSQLEICRASSTSVLDPADLGRVIATAKDGDAVFINARTVRNTGQHRYFQGSVNGVTGLITTDHLCAPGWSQAPGSAAAALLALHDAGATTLWDETFGRDDGASPLDNIVDAAAGRAAATSCYGGAPCDEVFLDDALLDGMVALARDHDYFVTSIAGASHSAGSLHYEGRAFDLDEIDGVRIQGDSSAARAFMNACWSQGAIEVFGPSNDPSGHYDHIHCAW